MKKYNVILFDLDGTLTDSKEGIVNSFKYSLKKFNIIEKDENKFKKFIGPPLNESFKKYYIFDDKNVKLAIQYYSVIFQNTDPFVITLLTPS